MRIDFRRTCSVFVGSVSWIYIYILEFEHLILAVSQLFEDPANLALLHPLLFSRDGRDLPRRACSRRETKQRFVNTHRGKNANAVRRDAPQTNTLTFSPSSAGATCALMSSRLTKPDAPAQP